MQPSFLCELPCFGISHTKRYNAGAVYLLLIGSLRPEKRIHAGRGKPVYINGAGMRAEVARV